MGSLMKYTEDDYELSLTNEQLNKNFSSRFDLVLYAIAATRKAVFAGRGKTVVGNLPFEVLTEMARENVVVSDMTELHASRVKVRKLTSTEKRIASSNRKRNYLEDALDRS